MAFAFIPIILSLALLVWWRSVVLFKRTVEDVPTSKVKGVFHGLNEVKGTVKSDLPLETYLTETPSVWYKWSISEEWRKTETYRDKDGNKKTRTKSGWRTVDSGGVTNRSFSRMIRANCSLNRKEQKSKPRPQCHAVALLPMPFIMRRGLLKRLRIRLTGEGFPNAPCLPGTIFTCWVRPS